MSRPGWIPEGYSGVQANKCLLICDATHERALKRADLHRVEGWSRRLLADGAGAGRGGSVRLELDDGSRVVLKQMRRGGLLAGLWRDRFLGRDRLLDNLRVPVEAIRRGVATARPLALLLVSGPPGLDRAWLATAEISGAVDLVRLIESDDPPTREEISTVVGEIRRMHDAGVEHPDLNLGNLLLRRDRRHGPRAFVVDLDRARLHPGPLRWRDRVRALRRLERSSVKLFGERPLDAFDLRRQWYTAYAAGDPEDEARLERARRSNRLHLALHRIGWRRGDGSVRS